MQLYRKRKSGLLAFRAYHHTMWEGAAAHIFYQSIGCYVIELDFNSIAVVGKDAWSTPFDGLHRDSSAFRVQQRNGGGCFVSFVVHT